MTTLRDTMMAEEDIVAAKRRFGLFNQPPPLAVGDDSLFPVKRMMKGEDGKPKTKPRNIYSGLNRTGVSKKDYMQVPESIYAKDEYVDTYKRELQYFNKTHSRSVMHETDFVPASGNKTLCTSSFNYVEQKEESKKSKRRPDGRVATEPAQITSNPTSKVQSRYMKFPTYIADPYSRKEEIEKQERLLWRKKLPQATFKSMSHGGNTFLKDKVQYGFDDKAKTLIQSRKERKSSVRTVMHQARFKLACLGHGEPINKFPEYMLPKSKTEESFRPHSNQNKEKEVFKPCASTLSRPTPSIGLHPTNLHVALLRRIK